MDSNETNGTNETNETDDQIINNEEPIILPIPVTLSQLMGSLMVNRIHNINQIPPIPAPPNEEAQPNDENDLPYENIGPTNNLFMNIFTRNRNPAQGVTQGQPQTFEEQIVNQTFNQQNKYKKVCSKDFINSLSVQKVTKEMVEKKITCGICLDELKEGEEIIELPCKDKHYFHIKNDVCDGIYPWLKDNNTCPLCRHEFPSDEKEIDIQTPVEPNRPILRQFNLMDIVNRALQDEEERILQQTILESLNDTNQENNDTNQENNNDSI